MNKLFLLFLIGIGSINSTTSLNKIFNIFLITYDYDVVLVSTMKEHCTRKNFLGQIFKHSMNPRSPIQAESSYLLYKIFEIYDKKKTVTQTEDDFIRYLNNNPDPLNETAFLFLSGYQKHQNLRSPSSHSLCKQAF